MEEQTNVETVEETEITTDDVQTDVSTDVTTANVSVYEGPDYSIQLIHEFTLGDVLISTLLSVLIVVHLLSRLIGGR